MTIEPGLFATVVGIVGTALLAGIGWIVRTLGTQNVAMTGQSQALAVLVARVDPAVQKTATLDTAVRELDGRVFRLELATGIIATPAPAPQQVAVNV